MAWSGVLSGVRVRSNLRGKKRKKMVLTFRVLLGGCRPKVPHKALAPFEAEYDSGKRDSVSGIEQSPPPPSPPPPRTPSAPGAGGSAQPRPRSPPGRSQGRIRLTDLEGSLHRLPLPALSFADAGRHLRGGSG